MAGMEPVTLPRPLVNRLLALAQAHPETEVCGLVGWRAGAEPTFYPVANVAEAPGRLFRMDPREQIAAMKAMRERGERLFAIYHSHPQGPARPSATDLAEAAYPEALYLICALGTEGVLELAAYRLRDGAAQAVPLTIAG